MTSQEPTPPTHCPRCATFLPDAVSVCPICGASLTPADGDATTVVDSRDARPSIPLVDHGLAIVREALSDEYEVIEELGRGGMAIVYRAQERKLGREVAIKVLPPTRVADEGFVERFQREARTAAQLEHPNIIPIHRVGEAGQVIYFAMRFVRGASLAAVLRERGTLPPAEIRRLLEEVGGALGYAARRGVVHRDIKPDNILREEESGRYLVSDFGIARSADASRLTEPGMSVGTPHYMSPEQASGKPLDGRSDIYSLGIVAYQCLVGHPPFEDGDSLAVLYAHVHHPLPRPALATPEERAVFSIVQRMLAKDPNERFQTGDDVVHAVRAPARAAASSSAPTEKLDTRGAGQNALDRMGPALDQAAKVVRRASRSVQRGAQHARSEVLPGVLQRIRPLLRSQPVRWATATRRRAFGTVVAAILVVWVGKTAVHFAAKHGSRCPETGSEFRVMLDPVGETTAGRNLDVYYDVCGLLRDTRYTVRLEVSGSAGGVRGLLGGHTSPVTVSFDEKARGPATRRHRTVRLPDLEPGGYALEVGVTTDDGRKASRRHDFQIVDR